MKFARTHLISILCGVAALAFIALATLGMTSRSVEKQMEARIKMTRASEISGLRAGAKNQSIIDAEKRRAEQFQDEFNKTFEEAKRINRREPLMRDVFPKPASMNTPLEFRDAYGRSVATLPHKLAADTLPSRADVLDEVQNVLDLKLLDAEKAKEGGGNEASIEKKVQQPTPPTPPTGRFFGEGGGPGRFGGEGAGGRFGGEGAGGRFGGEGGGDFEPSFSGGRMDLAGLDVGANEPPKYNPIYRARVAKARSIRCYYDPTTTHISPIVQAESPPPANELWFAQVGLWVQQDICEAIAGLNKEAVDRITTGEACVENSPVKRIVGMKVWGYVSPAGRLIDFPSLDDGRGIFGDAAPVSFTGKVANEQFDVVKFTVVLVVDQREVQRVIDAIGRVNFYQCIGASYEQVPPTDFNEGYLYGTGPVVRATLHFEGYLARAIYLELMPPNVAAALGVKRGD
jgi:hypothetical protein